MPKRGKVRHSVIHLVVNSLFFFNRASFPAKYVDEALSKFIVSQNEDLDVLKTLQDAVRKF
jgi:hypothetical protein